MKTNKHLIYIPILTIILLSIIACDKDFKTLDSDILNNNVATNFDILSIKEDLITYTHTLEPVQTNNLGINAIGVYNDAFGQSTASFVTQLAPTSFNASFKVNETDEIVLDSVILTLPYFSTTTDVNEDGTLTYALDSVYQQQNKIRLSLYESSYFIRDFDPNGTFEDLQPYFSNASASASEVISTSALESTEIPYEFTNYPNTPVTNNEFEINDKSITLTDVNNTDDDGNPTVTQRLAPSIRLKLNPNFWQEKILNQEGNSVLSSQNNFSEYFRGLYFKTETINNTGSYIILNTSATAANIVLYYTRIAYLLDENGNPTSEIESETQSTYTLNFAPNSINIFNKNTTTIPLVDGNSISGEDRIYIKGGEGAIAKIKLFNGEDIDGEDTPDNSFETWKKQFVVTDDSGNYIESKRLVNEANLVFYVDQAMLNSEHNEPHRIYLFDTKNNTPLIDYFLDLSNNNFPEFSLINHLGTLERDEDSEVGIKYKLRITEHINNLLLRDSTNVELGLSVSLNPNLEEFNPQRAVQTSNDIEAFVPVSAVISPMGTVLHGNATSENDKKVALEIFYTCLQDIENCETN